MSLYFYLLKIISRCNMTQKITIFTQACTADFNHLQQCFLVNILLFLQP